MISDSAIFCTFDVSSAGEAVFCILLHDTVSKHAAIIIANCFIYGGKNEMRIIG